jgi:CheY-like chemotaxis protein
LTEAVPPRARVLVIDDERAIVAAFVRLLGLRYDVVGLTDAREALQRIVAGETFDVILCDLFMPGMGGMQFYSELQNIDQRMTSRVVFLSGGAFTDDTQQFLEQIPNRTLAKPFDSERLLGLIRSMTD